MTEIAYLDFDLLIEGSEEGYTVQVVNCPAGRASADLCLPFSELELENFVLRMGRTRRGVRRLESSEMEGAKEFGGRLFDAVFQGEVRGCLRSSLDEAQRTGSGLRIRLRLDAPELADVPWEYLYNPSLNRFLALSVETPVVRYLDLPERIQPLAIRPPLQVLVMISNPGGRLALDVEGEWRVLKEAVADLERQGRVTLERLGRGEASLPALQKQLRRKEYHVFHFIGHGAFDERAEDGVLLLEDAGGDYRPVSGQFLGMLLHDERTLRLAILNACEGARTSRTDPFAGTAQSLVQQGIPAVIAMQFEFSDTAAITLAYEFYYALADGYPVDAALAEARKAIFAQGNDTEWGTAVLYLRAPDGRIFDIEQVSEEERQRARIVALHREAEMAMAQEDWATAIEKWETVLSLDPAHAEAEAGLSRVQQEQELATLYTKGREHYEAGRYREALDYLCQVDGVRKDYRDVGRLIAAIEREFVEVIDRELGKGDALYREAQVAMTREGWATAIGKLEDVLGMEPANIEAAAALRRARQEDQLANLYDRGREHYEAGRWQEALDTLRRVQDMREGYRDVGALILAVKGEIARSRAIRLPELPSIDSRWLRIGLPAALAVILLVFGGLFLAGAFSPRVIAPTPSATVTRAGPYQVAVPVSSTEIPSHTATVGPAETLATTATSLPAPTVTPSHTATVGPTETLTTTTTSLLTPTAMPTPTATVRPTPTLTDTPTPTALPTSTYTPSPSPSPSFSGRILFPVYDPDPSRRTFDVYAVSLDNGERELVREQASQPALSPDGKRLAYRSWDREHRGIWVLEPSKAEPWWATDIVQAARPSWSPDSEAIVVASDHVPGDAPRLYRSVGQELVQIVRTARTGQAESYAEAPAWLGDDRIVHRACSPEGCGLYIMDSDGNGVQRLTQGEHDTAPGPSPDGSQIAFMSDQDGNWEIYVVGTGSGREKPKRLTHDFARDGLPTWSPDGQWLAFVTNRGGRWSVWAMRPDGSDPQKLLELGGPLEGKIALVPDDQQKGWTWETIVWMP